MSARANMPTASIWTRNLVLSAMSLGFVWFSFFSYSALYASYTHTVLGFSVVDAGAALGMYGIGAMLGVFGGWLGDKISNRSVIGGLLLMATAGFVLFDGVPQFRLHLLLSLVFGLTMSGFLFTRFMSVLQRSVDPSQIGYAGAVALAAYLPGPFAGWLFGRLVETAGWSSASLLVVVGPRLLGVVLKSLYDFSKMRKD
jgi:predicted MFS family arabinose efflux permease